MEHPAPGAPQKIGAPQGSVLGPLLFNIFINDNFYLVNDTEVCNCADDTTLYVGDKNLMTMLAKLEKDTLNYPNGFLTVERQMSSLNIWSK